MDESRIGTVSKKTMEGRSLDGQKYGNDGDKSI